MFAHCFFHFRTIHPSQYPLILPPIARYLKGKRVNFSCPDVGPEPKTGYRFQRAIDEAVLAQGYRARPAHS